MMVSPGCGSAPEANWMIFWEVWRNWDTPVHGLCIPGPLSTRNDAIVRSNPTADVRQLFQWRQNTWMSKCVTYFPKVVCVLLVVWVVLQERKGTCKTNACDHWRREASVSGVKVTPLTKLLWCALVMRSIRPTRSVVETPCVRLHSR